MSLYMVEFTITTNPISKEFQALIPSEKDKVAELIKKGEIKHIWLKEDNSGGYFVAAKENIEELKELFNSLPLQPFLSFKPYKLKI